jgi:hypothetical protein
MISMLRGSVTICRWHIGSAFERADESCDIAIVFDGLLFNGKMLPTDRTLVVGNAARHPLKRRYFGAIKHAHIAAVE